MSNSILDALGDLSPVSFGATASKLQNLSELDTAKSISGDTTSKEYRKLTAAANATSHSKLSNFHKCPRYYELEVLRANTTAPQEPDSLNLDFAFGHAVGAGIQTYAATGSLQAAQFAAFIAWKAPYDAEKLDRYEKPAGKGLAWALLAVENFAFFFSSELEEYEVLKLPSGKPAVEVSFGIDTENGYFHFGHIDTVLRNKTTGQLAVWEGKTTGMEHVDDAAYGNSYQALGYGVVVDALAAELQLPPASYEVLYVVYSSKSRQFTLMPFTKNLTQRAEWLQDLIITHSIISRYSELGFFPKRGDNCLDKWGKKCKWYGTCQLRNSSIFPATDPLRIGSFEDVKSVDYKFSLTDLIAAQRERA